MNLCPGREAGINARAAKEVEGKDGLGQKTAPQMKGKEGISAAEPSNKVVFKRADGTFCSIATMDARGGQLEVDVSIMEVGFQDGGGFIVKTLEARFEASGNKGGMGRFVGVKDGDSRFRFHWFSMNVIGIVIIEDQELGVALTGGKDEASGLVGEDLSSGLHDGGETMVGCLTVGRSRREGIKVRGRTGWKGDWEGRGFCNGLRLGRAGVFLNLVKVAFGSSNRQGRVLGKERLGEAREVDEEVLVKCVC